MYKAKTLVALTVLVAASVLVACDDAEPCEGLVEFTCTEDCIHEHPHVPAICVGDALVCPGSMVPSTTCEDGKGSGGTDGAGGTGGTGGPGRSGGSGGTTAACTTRCTFEGCEGTRRYGCAFDDGCWVPFVEDCGAEGLSCWELGPEEGGRHVCSEPGCGDGIVQAGEGCDDGPNNGVPGRCSEWCQPLAHPTIDTSAMAQTATSTETYEVPDGHALLVEVDVANSGSVAHLILRDEVRSVLLRRGWWAEEHADDFVPGGLVSSGNDTQGKWYKWSFNLSFNQPPRAVGVHAGETLVLEIISENIFGRLLTVTLLHGDPAPSARVRLVWEGEEMPGLADDVDLPFELWVHEGAVPCESNDPLRPRCLSRCNPPKGEEAILATCNAYVAECPDDLVLSTTCD